MSPNPLVSIVITTYCRNDAARAAVTSAIDQDYDPIEVILVDGSGTENARPLANEFDIIYFAQPENFGLVSDRNHGFKQSNGEYVHFLDDDDRLRQSAIHRKVRVIQRERGTGVVYSGLYRTRDKKILLPEHGDQRDMLELVLRHQQPPCFPSTMLIDREILNSVLPIDSKYDGADDIVLITELAQRTNFGVVHEDLLVRGEEEESMAVTMKAVRKRREVIGEYDSLYDQYPPEVRRTAIAGTYSIEGQVYLKNHNWSLNAIMAFAYAVYYQPGIRFDFLGSLIASIFGRKVWLTLRRCLVAFRKWRGT